MPQNIINQPIQFNMPDKFIRSSEYAQAVYAGDKINFQILLDLDSADLITDGIGNYTQSSPGQWNGTGGTLNKPLANSGQIYQSTLTLSEYYQVNFTVLDINSDGELKVYIGTSLITTVTETGSFTVYGQAIGNARVTFEADAQTDVVVEDSVTAYLIETGNNLVALDLDDNWLGDLATSETYIADRNGLYQNINIPDENCYKLGIGGLGTNQLIQNFQFTSPSNWVLDPQLTITGGQLVATNVTQIRTASQIVTPSLNSKFSLTGYFEPITNMRLSVKIIHVLSGATVFINTFTGPPGNKNFGNVGLLKGESYNIQIQFDPMNPTNGASVDFLSMIGFDYSLLSNPFTKLFSNKGSILVESWNDSAYAGFEFENDFHFTMRIEANMQEDNSDTEAESYKDDIGVRTVYFNNDNETWLFVTGMVPTYIHRALRKMRLMNHFWLNDPEDDTAKEYVVYDSEYITFHELSSNLSSGQITVVQKVQDYYNRI